MYFEVPDSLNALSILSSAFTSDLDSLRVTSFSFDTPSAFAIILSFSREMEISTGFL